jgi:outer membrane protein assembly factor BamB
VAAIDALSGRVKWLMRYPYYAFPESVHDATRQFGKANLVKYTKILARPHYPMFWYNQRPLLSGEHLHIAPVDSPYLFSMDRRTGSVLWTMRKGDSILANRSPGGSSYYMGCNSKGELVVVYSMRKIPKSWAGPEIKGPIRLLDPATGKILWESDDLIIPYTEPIMKYFTPITKYKRAMRHGRWGYQVAARPFLSSDDKLYVTSFSYVGYPIFGYGANLRVVDLAQRRIVAGRRYLSGEILAACQDRIGISPTTLKDLEELPHKDKRVKQEIAELKEIVKDSGPANEHSAFMAFSRLTFKRYGVLFEGLFARAELALGDSRLREAAGLMKSCLGAVSSEDVDFRALVNQQLYKVHRRLARGGVRAGRKDEELGECMGMRRTVSTLSEEIETLFALSEAYERRGELETASRLLRSVISTYGHYEYPTPSLFAGDLALLAKTGQEVIGSGEKFVGGTIYGQEFGRALGLNKRGMQLYFSTLSPLEKDLMVRAGELAAGKLAALQKRDGGFARGFESLAGKTLGGRPADEQLYRLWEFPATPTAQRILDSLFAGAGGAKAEAQAERAALRLRLWRLADAARVCGLEVPAAYRKRVLAPPRRGAPAALGFPLSERKADLSDARGTAWLVAERRGQLGVRPELAFLAGRVKKKFDNKFVLHCVETGSGKVVWKATEKRGEHWFEELRLRGKGSEPGFSEVFVHGDVVVTHGLFDVLAFNLSDGKLRWRYRVPFDFEIKQAVPSGELLVLSGKAETLALYLPTADPRGEVIWQQKEEGDVYVAPYFHGDRLVSIRKLPFNLTVRYRATGKLMGRLTLPDLTLNEKHPLLEKGPAALPVASDGKLAVVSDGWYYIAVDVEKLKVVWKRQIDNSDPTREPTMRFCLRGDYLAVIKEDFDWKSIYMLSSRTGELLWNTDPKDAGSPRPIYSMVISGDTLYGIKDHPGQGFYFAAMDCKTGKNRFRPKEQKGYGGKPGAALFGSLYGDCLVVKVQDRQDFELRAFSTKGKLLQTVKVKGTGSFGEHGRASATVQNGTLLLFGKKELVTATK